MSSLLRASRGALAALVTLAACGDNTGAAQPDAADPTGDGSPASPTAIAVSGTFAPGEPGVMSKLDVDALEVAVRVAPNGAVAEDPILRVLGDELFVVNRAAGNNVTILDASTYAVQEQLATGAGSNPQDVAVVGSKLYVPGFGTAGVVVATRGSTTTSTIDLSALDPDGKPDCVSAFAVGADVYVACELLDANFSARGPGKVVVIDSATDTVRATLTLSTANPFGVFAQLPDGRLVIPTVPSFGDVTSGCIEAITPGATPTAGGCLVQSTALGGFPARLAVTEGLLWIVASSFDTGPVGRLQGYDLAAGTLWPEPVTPASQLVVDVAPCPNGKVVVADQTTAANGLRVYEGATEVTTAPLSIGIAPASNHGLACF